MENVQTAPQIDNLKDIAGNRWFVLGAYFFAFFPWMVMSNIDFISEKWRTCRRTRNLAYIHVASSIFPIIYVAVYAEAQRRDGDDKELGAALAALMFNVFQLMRTIMGILQLNAFVAWCKDGVLCMRALLGKDGEKSEQDDDPNRLSKCERTVACYKGWVGRMSAFMRRRSEDSERSKSGNYVEEDVEEVIEVNNSVVDNELGGREVTVLPSWQKMWHGVMKGSFKPSRWLWTDRVMLNTVRWGGAFLCGMGEHWSSVELFVSSRSDVEMLEKFFSEEVFDVRESLQFVEWSIELENGGREIFSVSELGNVDGKVELTGEMSSAYGTGCSYSSMNTFDVELYSFEFNSLVSSYPSRENRRNRERVTVELAHSVILAKHLGVERLKAIRRYYDGHNVPVGGIRRDAFRRLLEQTYSRIPDDDSRIWWMFESILVKFPLFPYRMQAVALWDEATNWRVLQASAHRDILLSITSGLRNQRILHNHPHEVDIFDFCAEWNMESNTNKCILGVVMETVRTFLAQWIVASGQEPVWEPAVPRDCFEFGLVETSIVFETQSEYHGFEMKRRLIWVCIRELQRRIAQTWSKDGNLPGNVEIVMLFLLGFPALEIEKVQDPVISVQESQGKVREGSGLASSNRDRSVNVNVQLWCVRTALMPQDISLMIQVDCTMHTVSLRLQTSGGDERFVWQDWIDAAMGFMKGAEERGGGDWGCGRQIVRVDLRKPMVEMCPLRLEEDGIEAVVKKTTTARVWLGWPVFDVGICKFEIEQWLTACDVDVNGGLVYVERVKAENEMAQAEEVIGAIKSAENDGVEGSTHDSEV